VFSGRLVPVKRPQIALEAFLEIADRRPAWDLVVVGDGPLRAPLENLVPEGLRSRVRWTGFLDHQSTISAIYRASDVLILPSEKEPWGLVVNEAVAAGMAVVCTDIVGAGAELVESAGNGWTLPRSATPHEWAEALLTVTADDQIDRLKLHSAIILDRWRKQADPVAGFRAAMAACEKDQHLLQGVMS
jgi:glycosyltransferase involved in cell wall biosynthesis